MISARHAVLIGLVLVNLYGDQLHAQANCSAGPTYPTTDTAVTTGPPSGDAYASAFTITLVGGAGNGTGSFTGFSITEADASPGTDTCATALSNPALIPPSPSVAGSTWQVVGTSWGPDDVGWLPASVTYIQQNPGVINIPCTAQINQALSITCPGDSTPYLYNPDNPLDVYTISVDFQNCRGPIASGNQVCSQYIPY